MSSFIATTPLSRLQPVGSEGERSHARLSALLTRHLSAEHAALFADPVPLRDGSGIDWYVEEDGAVLAVSDLPADQAESLRARVKGLLGDIRAKADEIERTSPGGAAAAALRNATVHPGDRAIYAVETALGMKPVLVAWGHQEHDPAAFPHVHITAPDAPRGASPPGAPHVAQMPMPPAGPTGARRADAPAAVAGGGPVVLASGFRLAGLLPFLLLLLALLLFWLIAGHLIPACGLRTPFGSISFGFGPVQSCGVVPTVQRPSPAGLERELAVLQEQLEARQQACASAPPPAPPASQGFDERIDRRGEVQVTLIWDGTDDLDLMIQCPGGPLIYYRRGERKHCGGELDVDRNAENADLTSQPVENITFQNGLSESGSYPIRVKLYRKRTPAYPIPFRVRIREGDATREIDGRIDRPDQLLTIGELSHP